MKTIFTLDFIKQILLQFDRREIKGLPEQIAFNLVMSIVPLLVVIVQIGTRLSLNTAVVEYLIVSYAPTELQGLLNSLFETPPPTTTTTFLLITTGVTFVWLISKGFYGISSAANITYQVPKMRFAYLERIFAFLMVCLLVIALIIGLILYLFGQVVLMILFDVFGWIFLNDYFIIFNLIKSFIGFSAYFIFFTFLFYFTPSMSMKLHQVIPGALITAIGWSIASIGFSFYVNRIAEYSKFYGSLAVIIILLFWLYLLGYTIVLGLQINYLLLRDSSEGVVYEPRIKIRHLNLSEFVTEPKESEK